MSQQKSFAFLFMIAGVLQIVWGLVPSASKYVIDEIPVELYITLRWSISGAVFLLYLLLLGQWKKIALQNLKHVMLLGIFGYGVASFGTLYGLKTGGVTNFALISAVSPIILSLMSILILKERPQKLFLLILPLSFFGLLLVVLGKYQISNFNIAGLSALMVVGAYILEALIFVRSKKYQNMMPLPQYLAISQLSAAGIMWCMQGVYFRQVPDIFQLSLRGWGALIFVAIVACVFCYAVLYWLLNYIEGHRLAIFDGLHVISAAICGIVLFGEKLNSEMMIGGGLILGAILLMAAQKPKVHAEI